MIVSIQASIADMSSVDASMLCSVSASTRETPLDASGVSPVTSRALAQAAARGVPCVSGGTRPSRVP
jgi:hypothetical protein